MTTAHLVLTLYIGLIFLAAATRADAADPPKGPVVMAQITALRACQTQLGVDRAKAPAFKNPHSDRYWKWQLDLWTARQQACLKALHERARQWNWQAWLPDKWRRIGVCETGLNWAHANSSYVSAFGIWIGVYDSDAAYKGVRPWYVSGKGHPSPWEQYQAALGHYERFGGFSGWGCRNA